VAGVPVTTEVLPVPFLRSLGIAGVIIAAMNVRTNLTVLPVLLALTGHRLDRRPDRRLARHLGRRLDPRLLRRFRLGRRVGHRRDRRGATAGQRHTGVLAGGRFEREAQAGRAWSAWARGVVRWRWPAALVSGGLLLALALTGLGVNLGLPESGNLRT